MFVKDQTEINARVKKAISEEMFLEATMLENVLLDMIADNILKNAGESFLNYPLGEKIRKMNMLYATKSQIMQTLIDRNIIGKLQIWDSKKTREIQALINSSYSPDKFKTIALEGNSLVDHFIRK